MTPELRKLFLKAVQDRKTLIDIFGKAGDSFKSENKDRAAIP